MNWPEVVKDIAWYFMMIVLILAIFTNLFDKKDK